MQVCFLSFLQSSPTLISLPHSRIEACCLQQRGLSNLLGSLVQNPSFLLTHGDSRYGTHKTRKMNRHCGGREGGILVSASVSLTLKVYFFKMCADVHSLFLIFTCKSGVSTFFVGDQTREAQVHVYKLFFFLW